MADIFLSYASQDRERARPIAESLQRQGWSVWWDRSIAAGKRFEEVITEELARARCVVVLWSQASVKSDWVRDEAGDARERKILVPVLIERVNQPFGFRQIQAADLTDWNGSADAAAFKQLVVDLGHLIGDPRKEAEVFREDRNSNAFRVPAAERPKSKPAESTKPASERRTEPPRSATPVDARAIYSMFGFSPQGVRWGQVIAVGVGLFVSEYVWFLGPIDTATGIAWTAGRQIALLVAVYIAARVSTTLSAGVLVASVVHAILAFAAYWLMLKSISLDMQLPGIMAAAVHGVCWPVLLLAALRYSLRGGMRPLLLIMSLVAATVADAVMSSALLGGVQMIARAVALGIVSGLVLAAAFRLASMMGLRPIAQRS